MRSSEIAKYFDKRSVTYDKERVVFREKCANLIAKLAKPSKKDVILDMGTGTGYMVLKLANKVSKIIGVDISEKMLEVANQNIIKAKIPNAIIAFGTFENPSATLNLKSLGITKIISNCAMHYMTDKAKKIAILHMIKLLNGSGKILIGDKMTVGNQNPENYADIYRRGHDLIPKADFLADIFRKNGFKVKIHKASPLVCVIEASLL